MSASSGAIVVRDAWVRRADATDARRDAEAVLADVSIRVAAGGAVTAIMGASGAGKTTLALVIAGLAPLDRGTRSSSDGLRVRMLLQRPETTLFRDTVRAELLLTRHGGRHHSRQGGDDAVVGSVLDAVGLDRTFAERDPLALSGGEQRRVALAAVLIDTPDVLVLDEPCAGLDAAARREVHDVVRSARASGVHVVLVTHDPDEAAMLADRLVVVRDGRVVHDGRVDEVLGQVDVTRSFGLVVAPEVALARELGATEPLRGDRESALQALAHARAKRPSPTARASGSSSVLVAHGATPASPRAAHHWPSLPPLIDARLRLMTCVAFMVCGMTAPSLLGIALAFGAAVACARVLGVQYRRIARALRPLVMVAATLALIELFVGSQHDVVLARAHETSMPIAHALRRTMQAAVLIVAALGATATTSVVDLAAALRRLARPLNVARIPVDTMAFVTATALGLLPRIDDDLTRLRLARRARGLHTSSRNPLVRIRHDALLLTPLAVGAFRRSRLTAEALVTRGRDPRVPTRSWRPRTLPANDVTLFVVAVSVLVLARFA